MRPESFIQKAKDIVNGVCATSADDIHSFECWIGESLCDSNHWSSNPFTLLGFSYARHEYHIIANAIRDEIKESDHPDYVEPMVVEPLMDDYDLYCQWCADIINAMPDYRQRWFDNLQEVINT